MKSLYFYIKHIKTNKKIYIYIYIYMNIDICSDLHIDQWNKNLEQKYPCGIRKYNPEINFNSNNNILILAGDISDNLDLNINFINNLSNKYKYILFIDGNHEHVEKYPSLYSKEYIFKKIKKYGCKNLIYLPYNDFILDKTVFIGCCGWWDYNNFNISDINNSLNYFDNWISDLSKSDSREFIYNVYERSKLEYKELIEKLEKYQNDSNINNIIIVTHSQPRIKFTSIDLSTEINTKFEDITKKNYSKLNSWIFGHTHEQIIEKTDINYICNPRGRPEDYDREDYSIYNLKLE